MPKPRKADQKSTTKTNPHRYSIRERVLNCNPSKSTKLDWNFQVALNVAIASSKKAAKQKDLRASWWKVGEQGKTGSCLGWALADGVLRWQFVDSGQIGKRDKHSVRYVWMASKETDQFNARPTSFIEDSGTSLKAGLDVCRKFGVVKESVLPFESKKNHGFLFPENRRSSMLMRASSRLKATSTWKKTSNNGAGGSASRVRSWLISQSADRSIKRSGPWTPFSIALLTADTQSQLSATTKSHFSFETAGEQAGVTRVLSEQPIVT